MGGALMIPPQDQLHPHTDDTSSVLNYNNKLGTKRNVLFVPLLLFFKLERNGLLSIDHKIYH